MKKTKQFFNSEEVIMLATLVSECAATIAERGVTVDDAKRVQIAQRVMRIAERGVIDPNEIRKLIFSRYEM